MKTLETVDADRLHVPDLLTVCEEHMGQVKRWGPIVGLLRKAEVSDVELQEI